MNSWGHWSIQLSDLSAQFAPAIGYLRISSQIAISLNLAASSRLATRCR